MKNDDLGVIMYSIVIPCYKSSHTIRQVVTETSAKMEEMGRTPFEFVLVDDCSPDDGETVRELHSLCDDFSNITVIELAINAGQHNAMMAGLNYAEGDVTANINAGDITVGKKIKSKAGSIDILTKDGKPYPAGWHEITAALERMIREAPSFRARVEERRNKYTYAGLVDRLETDYQELA